MSKGHRGSDIPYISQAIAPGTHDHDEIIQIGVIQTGHDKMSVVVTELDMYGEMDPRAQRCSTSYDHTTFVLTWPVVCMRTLLLAKLNRLNIPFTQTQFGAEGISMKHYDDICVTVETIVCVLVEQSFVKNEFIPERISLSSPGVFVFGK